MWPEYLDDDELGRATRTRLLTTPTRQDTATRPSAAQHLASLLSDHGKKPRGPPSIPL
jgi:hypothetical protein